MLFWRKRTEKTDKPEKKKASSAEDVANVTQTDNKDGEEFKRGRFHSLRKSFRRLRSGSSKKKKDKRIQEENVEKGIT